MNDRTLCFLIRGNPAREVLLGLKKAGFGAGKYAGFGGKVEVGETIEAAAIRELEEEAGVRISLNDLCSAGRITFEFPSKPQWTQTVHVFLAKLWSGNPRESNEMKPNWCLIDQIPYGSMWDDAHYWLPLVLKEKKIKVEFTYKDDNETVSQVKIEEMAN